MDLGDLAIFQAVLQEGGITAAARRLNRVQSNITTRIRQLEDDLGVSLFQREGKRLQPTPAARILQDYAGQLLGLAQEARDAVISNAPQGQLRLGAMENTAAVRLPPLLADFHQRYPAVQLELRTGATARLIAEVLAGTLDCALVCGPVADARLESQPFCRETLLLIGARGRPPLLEDRPHTLLAFDSGCAYRQRLELWLRHSGCAVDRIVELDSYHAMISCAASGMGLALVPQALLACMPAGDSVTCHALPDDIAIADTVLIRRRQQRHAAVDAFAGLLAACATIVGESAA
ncbi:LysR family transcriptional regulator [Vogesella indigofera]|uniref:LysR family transcriptional regulator n=1 Tax=Vogesella indigofera TaxID=45465 RepID=UPI00234EFC49|nr:LysR family transcriptional regulator [Vogesella indigofera]MDC7701276.1 LysR family transcriptional regulator [Vogesella indigofera]MDC7708435.1 LysR family transcriptional regulator [Vogesella indigofera]